MVWHRTALRVTIQLLCDVAMRGGPPHTSNRMTAKEKPKPKPMARSTNGTNSTNTSRWPSAHTCCSPGRLRACVPAPDTPCHLIRRHLAINAIKDSPQIPQETHRYVQIDGASPPFHPPYHVQVLCHLRFPASRHCTQRSTQARAQILCQHHFPDRPQLACRFGSSMKRLSAIS